MPAVRLSRRRRSSLGLAAFNPAKAGHYGIQRQPIVTFAPNVTPVTYVDVDADPLPPPSPSPPTLTSKLFPPSEYPPPAPSRRRVPAGKRRSMGYIPRPPNAFMLFRADFVRQKHVPGSIETNHGSLSKIIGNCWKSLPLDEKRIWEVKAKHAKAEHKVRYPEYRFRPVHNKNKDAKKKEKAVITPRDESRCEAVAQLLLEGKKGDELAAAVRDLDRITSAAPTSYHLQHRRSSSVPLPNDWNPIAIPALPFYSRASSSSSPHNRGILGQRRASSADPLATRSWRPSPMPLGIQQLMADDEPLPEVDTSLFEESFLNASDGGFSFPVAPCQPPFDFQGFVSNLPPHAIPLGPLDTAPPHNYHPYHHQPHHQFQYPSSIPPSIPAHWPPHFTPAPSSDPSSAYSGSPAIEDSVLPLPDQGRATMQMQALCVEEQVQQGYVEYAGYDTYGFGDPTEYPFAAQTSHHEHHHDPKVAETGLEYGFGFGFEFPPQSQSESQSSSSSSSHCHSQESYLGTDLDSLFPSGSGSSSSSSSAMGSPLETGYAHGQGDVYVGY